MKVLRVLLQVVQYGQHERERLACSRWAYDRAVFPAQNQWDRLLLYGRRLGDMVRFEAIDEIAANPELAECLYLLLFFLLLFAGFLLVRVLLRGNQFAVAVLRTK